MRISPEDGPPSQAADVRRLLTPNAALYLKELPQRLGVTHAFITTSVGGQPLPDRSACRAIGGSGRKHKSVCRHDTLVPRGFGSKARALRSISEESSLPKDRWCSPETVRIEGRSQQQLGAELAACWRRSGESGPSCTRIGAASP